MSDPKWLVVDDFPDGRYVQLPIKWQAGGGHRVGVTTVGEMRGRTDLDRWEIANFEYDRWEAFGREDFKHSPDEFPVIVRRVK